MKLIKYLIIIIIFSSCAATYNTIEHDKIFYNQLNQYDNIVFSYKTDAISKNIRYNRKVRKNNIELISIRIHNKSDNELIIGQDILFYNREEKINQIPYENVIEKTCQIAPIYLLYMLRFSFVWSGSGDNDTQIGISPLGLAFGLVNTIIAGVSNNKFKKDLIKNSIENKIIKPNSVFYGIIALKKENNLDLKIVNLTNHIAKTSILNINELIQMNDSIDKSYDEYFGRIKKELENQKLIEDIKIEKDNYENGKLKFIGIKVKHKYSSRKTSWNQIGTWKYYYSNGNLQQIVNLDFLCKFYGDIKIYSMDGNQKSFN
ncbi:MAG: hypothetical protein KAT68_06615 [Bacteroidales bacterium]|nr:hypothetical protein [Bacteroidales bacterium]